MATGHWRLTLETILGLGTGGQRWIGSISVFTTGSMPANGVQHNQSIYGWSNKTALGIEQPTNQPITNESEIWILRGIDGHTHHHPDYKPVEHRQWLMSLKPRLFVS